MTAAVKHWMNITLVPALLAWSQPMISPTAQASPSTPPAPAMVSREAGPAPFESLDAVQLRRSLERELTGFVRNNYPSHLNSVMRNLQNREGKLHKDISEATGFLMDFARGPMTLEGIWREWGGKKRYLLVHTIRGVKGSPDAIVSFTTYPGFLRPFTIVEVDENGDGKTDQKSTALCRCDTLKDWLAQNLTEKKPV